MVTEIPPDWPIKEETLKALQELGIAFGAALQEATRQWEDSMAKLNEVIYGGEKVVLGGRELVDVLCETVKVEEEFHYLEMVLLLSLDGVRPRGKDPPNTLLAALQRDERFEKSAPRSGMYRRVA